MSYAQSLLPLGHFGDFFSPRTYYSSGEADGAGVAPARTVHLSVGRTGGVASIESRMSLKTHPLVVEVQYATSPSKRCVKVRLNEQVT